MAFCGGAAGARRALSDDALLRLTETEWPGNVRQLLHVVENACVMSASEVLDRSDFVLEPERTPESEDASLRTEDGGGGGSTDDDLDLPKNLERLERALIKRAIQKAGGNRALAARLLGIRRQHLYSRIEALGIDGPSSRD